MDTTRIDPHFFTDEDSNLIDLAICEAQSINGYDKAGELYKSHLFNVYRLVRKLYPSNAIAQTVSLLHDMIEDGHHTEYSLIDAGFNTTVVDTVLVLTKSNKETYSEYIERVKTNDNAVIVKIADLTHNLDLTRFKRHITEEDVKRSEKYLKALRKLIIHRDKNDYFLRTINSK